MPIERVTRVHSKGRGGLPFVVLLMALAGCSDAPSYPFAHVAGAVSVDGVPVAEGKLVLLPMGVTRGPAVGVPIVAGRYDCPRAPRGKLLVQIHALRESGKMLSAMGKTFPEQLNIVPERDRAGIETEVAGDNLQLDFLLSSTASPR